MFGSILKILSLDNILIHSVLKCLFNILNIQINVHLVCSISSFVVLKTAIIKEALEDIIKENIV